MTGSDTKLRILFREVKWSENSVVEYLKGSQLLCMQLRKFDADRAWVQEQCLGFAKHQSVEVRWAAVACLGDLAFLRRPLDLVAVIPVLEGALTDPEIADPARFSLSLVKQFCQ